MVWSAGSVVDYVTRIVGAAVPTSISGTNMNDIVYQQIYTVEQYTGESISTSSIPNKYQPPICNLTQAQVLRAIDAQEGGADDVSLGELRVSQAGAGGNASLAQSLIDTAMRQLKELGRNVRVFKVWGA